MTDKDIKVKEANDLLVEKAEQLRKEQFIKDKEDDFKARQRETQNKFRSWLDGVRKSDKIMDERTGKETTLWEQVKKLADDVINAEQTSINDWRSNMMSLLNFLRNLIKQSMYRQIKLQLKD